MKTSYYRYQRFCLQIAQQLIGLIFLVLIPKAHAQDASLMQGELEIQVLPEGTLTTIIVQAVGDVYDTRCDWYQRNLDLDYWEASNTDFMRLRFVDRSTACPPDQLSPPLFGYGLYRVWVGTASIFVDFRDADYGTRTGYQNYQDMHLSYRPNENYFIDDDHDRYILLGQTYHIWDMQPKPQEIYPLKVPVTVRNHWQEDIAGLCPLMACGRAHRIRLSGVSAVTKSRLMLPSGPTGISTTGATAVIEAILQMYRLTNLVQLTLLSTS